MKSQLRSKRWHGNIPTNPKEARLRLLDAATECFKRHGISRTTVDDIAYEAGVHRSTMYQYFSNREAILADVFERESQAIINTVTHNLTGSSFLEGIVTSISAGVELAKNSPTLTYLMGSVSQGQSIRETAITDTWKELVCSKLAGPMSAAIDRGEIRSDVPIKDLLEWTLRIALSVTAEPTENVEQTLNWFLVSALKPLGTLIDNDVK